MKRIILLSIGLCAISCGTAYVPVESKAIRNDIDPTRTMSSEVGKTLVSKDTGFWYDAIQITANVDGNNGGMMSRVPSEGDILTLKGKSGEYDLYFGKSSDISGIAIKDTVASVFDKVNENGRVLIHDPFRPIKYRKIKTSDKNSDSYRQEFVYNGKSGNTVKFVYREYVNSLARPAFYQEVNYDLAEGNTVGFKGLRIEIVKASNVGIEYRALSNFTE